MNTFENRPEARLPEDKLWEIKMGTDGKQTGVTSPDGEHSKIAPDEEFRIEIEGDDYKAIIKTPDGSDRIIKQGPRFPEN